MSAKLKKSTPLLRVLAKSKPSVTKAVIKAADRDLVDALCECGLNVLKGNIPLTLQQKRRLARHKLALRSLVKRGGSIQKKKVLLQKGGFLGALLSPVLGILGGLLGGR